MAAPSVRRVFLVDDPVRLSTAGAPAVDVAIALTEALAKAGSRISDVAVVAWSTPVTETGSRAHPRSAWLAAGGPVDTVTFPLRAVEDGSLEALVVASQTVASHSAELALAVITAADGTTTMAQVASERYLVQSTRCGAFGLGPWIVAGWDEDQIVEGAYEAIVRWCVLNTVDSDTLGAVGLRTIGPFDAEHLARRLRIDTGRVVISDDLAGALAGIRATDANGPRVLCESTAAGQCAAVAVAVS